MLPSQFKPPSYTPISTLVPILIHMSDVDAYANAQVHAAAEIVTQIRRERQRGSGAVVNVADVMEALVTAAIIGVCQPRARQIEPYLRQSRPAWLWRSGQRPQSTAVATRHGACGAQACACALDRTGK